jgi:hypothetical protein
MKKCIACGCSDRFACPGGCRWVSHNPPKCSACFDDDGTILAVGDPDLALFGIELCPASDVPAPHTRFFADANTCYCARCKMDLAA